MNSSNYQEVRPSPRRELQLQGPRPTPLNVNKDSYKIKKPPATSLAAPPPQHRPPVIIYTVSPKIIHTSPRGFMSLVQRLTGPSTPSYATALSPAARLATIERTATYPSPRKSAMEELDHMSIDTGSAAAAETSNSHPGILSPVPSSLPVIPASFFSNTADPNNLGFSHNEQQSMSTGGFNRSFVDNTFLVSPNNFLTSPVVPSPGAYWDLFNQYQDF